MPDEGKTLSAAERRERRLKRILGNSEERMKKILSGPDGDEQRLPPMLEGGEYRSSLLTSDDDESSGGIDSYTDLKLLSSNKSCCQHPILQSVKRMDTPLSLFFGLFARILMANGIMFNVLVPWILISLGPHFFAIAKETPQFFNDLMTVLRFGSYSTLERILRRGHAALSVLHAFTSRLLVMVTGFLLGHSALIIFHGLRKDLTAVNA